MQKGQLQKVIDEKFGRRVPQMSGEMVADFCTKHGFAGSGPGYSLYTAVGEAIEMELERERTSLAIQRDELKEIRKQIR